MFMFKIILGIIGIVSYTLVNAENFKSDDKRDTELKYLKSLERLEKANINYTKNKIKQLIS